MTAAQPRTHRDAILIGAGIMSATVAALLGRLEPGWRITVLERLDRPAAESTDPWNNAGTGHSALCELNYTPSTAHGVDIAKAVHVNEQFQLSRQFWGSLAEAGELAPATFIHSVPHMSMVQGAADVSFLQTRFDALREHPLFAGMAYSEDRARLADWMPLVMDGRDASQPVAATRAEQGTDVDFGALARQLLQFAQRQGVTISYATDVQHLRRLGDGTWEVDATSRVNSDHLRMTADFVFIGAGGGSLPLLQASHIPEAASYGGFPISGQFLRCTNPDVIARHHAKVYGKAAVGAPPMSVPHLDTRIVDGKPALMFGPYAGWSPKFLQHGSWLDLFGSVRPTNVVPMLQVARDHLDLVRYLATQVAQTTATRLKALREFVPTVMTEDWELITAGQRVQVIKQVPGQGGVLQFGTELVSSTDGTLAGLLGASPGASTAVPIAYDLIARCFPERASGAWARPLRDLVPTWGRDLAADPELVRRITDRTARQLGLA